MAEEAEEGKKEEAPPPKKSKMMLFVVIGVVLLLIAGGAAAFFFMNKEKKESKEELGADAALEEGLTPEGADEESELEEGEEALGALYPLETFVVNLDGGRYIKVQMQLEFVERDLPKRFFTQLVPIRDAIIMSLTKKNSEEVLSDKGKEKIKSETKEIVNELLRKEEVKKVYFTQYVVQ